MNELVAWNWADNEFEDEDLVPFQDLQACCLTSRAFLGPARARLYRTAYVTIEVSEMYSQTPPAQRDWAEHESERVASMEQRLEATLVLTPHLAALVREVVVTYNRRPCPAELVPTLALAGLLRACPLVQTLTVRVCGHLIYEEEPSALVLDDDEANALARVILACRPALRRAELRDVVCESTAGRILLYSALVQIPTLQHLWLPSAATRRVTEVPLERGPAELRTLGIDYIPKRDNPFLNNIFKNSVGSNLLELTFDQRPCDVREKQSELPGMIHLLTKLTKLSWRFSPSTETHPSTSAAEGTALVFGGPFDDLEHLPLTDFSLINLNRFGTGNEDLVDDLDYLPPTLKRLHIPLPPPDVLADLLKDGKKHSPLLEVTMQLGRDGNAQQWTPWAMGRLRKLCRRRGMRIEVDGVVI